MIAKFVEQVNERVPSFLEPSQFEVLIEQVGETRGVYLPNFLHGSVFRRVIKHAFEAPLKDAGSALVENLAASVKAALSALLGAAASDYPALLERLTAIAHAVTDEERERALGLVHDKVDAEMTAPFTVNAEYERLLSEFECLLTADAGIQIRQHGEASSFPSEYIYEAIQDIRSKGAEAAMTRRLQVSLHAYQLVLQARLFDCIPMDVRHRIMYSLHARLAPTLLREAPHLLHLLNDEKPGVSERRNEREALVQKLRSAASLISDVQAGK